MEMQEAFTLFNAGRHLKVRAGGNVYENVLIKALNAGSQPATVTLVLPTPIGEPTRVGVWRVDQVEVVT
jgi:hypothetical protein